MPPFDRKKITTIQTLSEILRSAREGKGISTQQLADRIGVSEKYICALEKGEYTKIPGDVYIRIYLEKYCVAVGLSYPECKNKFEHERSLLPQRFSVIVQRPRLSVRIKDALSNTPASRIFFISTIALITLALGTYISLQLRVFSSPPPLEVTQPAVDISISEFSYTITGTTTQEAQVLINGQEIPTEDSGQFAYRIYLQPGQNELTITARKKNGQETNVRRTIVVSTNPALEQARQENVDDSEESR